MEDTTRVFLLLIFCIIAAVKGEDNMTAAFGGLEQANEVKEPQAMKSTFHMHLQGNMFEDTCTVVPFRSETLSTCGYNSSSPLVIIIHGWTINGLMEEWMFRMASALKARLGYVNVLISDWRPLAFQPYPNAAKNSRQVGSDVARLVEWLEETTQLSTDKVHLIGYSLGAHVAGFAGSHFKSPRMLGRITGLDPAGPQFEGVPALDRLSRDDAKFVDAIHTFSKSTFGLAVGIRQPVGHVDFYPNGGSFQPGCQVTDIHNNLFGLQGLPKSIKCTHQRAVHLFTDSLLNTDQQMTAYRCRNDSAFDKGLCLDCKMNRCNILGYSVRRVYPRNNTKGLYLKTGSQTPFKVYHYQIKVFVKNLIEPAEASVSVSISLNGTKGQSKYLPVTLNLEDAQKTYSALTVVDSDMGHLNAVWLRWEQEAGWTSWWRRLSSIVSGSSQQQNTELSVGRIRLKSGERQEKIWFCGKAGEITHLKPTQEQEFLRC